MKLNSNEIQKIIPHRYPFLLIDRIDELIPGVSCVATKNVSVNEMHFMGHFPDEHIMPGVLIVEAMAQAGAVIILSLEENKGKTAYFAGIDKCKFKRKVIPGDTLRMEIEIIKQRGPIGHGKGTVYVGDEIAVVGEMKFVIGQ